MVEVEIDISENNILLRSPELLAQLLRDHTTGRNIFWATHDYEHLGKGYGYKDEIQPELITGEHGDVIMPRVLKSRQQQTDRSKDMAEVFTPSWICNAQNNLVDEAWFGRKDVFNTENNQDHTWLTNPEQIEFPDGKTWKDYVRLTRMEITCGEAPYLVSRYDTTTGQPIPIRDRIGLLDRKLRVVSENTETTGDWLEWAQTAYQNIYGYEWQGDNLLLAREALLWTFIEYYQAKFGKAPLPKSINYIAYIISWNLWQMDGLRGVVPGSNLFGNTFRNGRRFWKINQDENMKLDAIVSNPPYQVMDGGTDRGAVPVYQHFVEIAKKSKPNYISMIMPARWYAGGRGLDDFRENMLSDKRIQALYDFETSKDLFPTVDIAGGLCYFLWNKSSVAPCKVFNVNPLGSTCAERYLDEFPVFVRSNASVPILKKVTSQTTEYLNSLVLSINPFGFRTYFRGRKEQKAGDIKILTSEGWGYVSRSEITKGTVNVDKYKIIVGRFVPSNGELNVKPGEGYRVLTTPRMLSTDEINTETYIDTAVFDTLEEATNYKNYLCTKFARYLLRQAITSVNVTRECFAFVPMQDFTQPWTDAQLYQKYGLTDAEISIIETMIKPIE